MRMSSVPLWAFGLSRLACWLVAALLSAHAAAQDYPGKTIRIIVPFPPGGLDASSEQVPAERGAGARARDATVKLATSASFLAPAPCASPGSDPGGSPLRPCDAPRLRDASVRESAAAAVLVAQASAPIEQYPNRPIRIIVPFPPGGATDVVTRIVAQKLTDQMGQQVVTENRGGAGGIVGSEAVAKAAPDGYTLVMGTTGTHAINASLYPKLAYDPIRDFVAVTRTALLANMIVAHPAVPAKNVRELIALAKTRPGEITYASSGSALYLSGALFTSMAGIDLVHIPYKGGGQAMPALLGGEVALSFATVVSSLPHVRSGKLRALGVTSAQRTPAAPEFPTVAESGLSGYEAVAWYGVLAPAATPRGIVMRLNSEIVRALRLPEVQQLLLAQGAEPVSDTPEQFAAVLKADVVKWGEVVRKSGAKAD